MRVALAALIGFALVVTASGQRGGHGGGGGVSHGGGGGVSHGGSAGGFSRGFSGGTMHSGMSRGGFSTGVARGGFNRGGTVFRGPNRGVFVRNGFRRFGNGFRFYGWPYYGYYGYPYYYDPYFWDDSSYNSYPTPDQTTSYYYNTPWEPAAPEPVEQPPMVVYQAPPLQPPAYQAPPNSTPEYLIAFNDHNIKIAVAYWTEKTNLKYVTTDHEIKTAPLSSVDRDLSMRLNQERRVTFNLPASGA